MRPALTLASGIALLVAGVSLMPAAPSIDKPEPWATVKGRVVWAELKLPEQKEIEITADATALKECLKDNKLLSEDWVVNKDNRGVRWTMVWLAPQKPPDPDARTVRLLIHPDLKRVSKTDVEIDAPCGQFAPRVLGMQDTQNLKLNNSASIAYHLRLICPNGDSTQVRLLPGTKVNLGSRDAADSPHSLTCALHPWMQAWIWVFDHPYFAVTDADGGFEIKNAPAGECRLFIWHETAGWLNKGGGDGEPITIKAGELKDFGEVDAKEH